MSTNVATAQAHPRASILAKVAERYSVEPAKLLETLRATAFKGQVSNEQMMALLIVADQYKLNPFTKEIYAFPDKGGIVPVVGVDGWARILNEHAQFDGIEFDGDGESATCTIYRKDRAHPIRVTEYMRECRRDTGPWKSHPQRMLRHKAMIQCARLAFGFAGIYDQDEAERIRDMGMAEEVQRPMPPQSAGSAARLKAAVAKPAPTIDADTGEIAPPPAQNARTLGQYSAEIDSATDAETAALVLDAARDELDATDHAALAEHWRARWETPGSMPAAV